MEIRPGRSQTVERVCGWKVPQVQGPSFGRCEAVNGKAVDGKAVSGKAVREPQNLYIHFHRFGPIWDPMDGGEKVGGGYGEGFHKVLHTET